MSRMLTILAATAVLSAASVAAACGGDDATSSPLPAGSPAAEGATPKTSAGGAAGKLLNDPCSALSLNDVKSVIPDAKAGVVTVKTPVAAACSWDSAANPGKGLSLVFTRSTAAIGKAGVDEVLNGAGASAKKIDVGGGGVFTGSALGFFKGDVAVQIVLASGASAPESVMVALAKKVAEKL